MSRYEKQKNVGRINTEIRMVFGEHVVGEEWVKGRWERE